MSLTKSLLVLLASPVLLEVVQVVHFPQRHVLQYKAFSDSGFEVVVIDMAIATVTVVVFCGRSVL